MQFAHSKRKPTSFFKRGGVLQKFDYQARDSEGAYSSGTIEATDRDSALETLSERFAVVTSLRAQKVRRGSGLFKPRVSGEDRMSFAQAVSSMLNAGLGLVHVIRIYERDTPNPAMRSACASIASALAAGKPLSEALDEQTEVFDALTRNVVRAGETAGNLEGVLEKIAAYIETQERIKERVKSALTYPIIVLIFSIVCGLGLVLLGIPQLEQIYRDMGRELPPLTAALVAVFGKHGVAVVLLLATVAALFWAWLRTSSGQAWLDKIKLSGPTANLFQMLYTSRFASTLSILYTSGIPLNTAIRMAGDTVGNSIVAARFEKMAKHVEGGGTLAAFLRDDPVLTDMAAGLIAAGEEGGNLDHMLGRVASFYEMKFYSSLESLTASIEPAMMMVVGGIVAGLILALGLPFMNLAAEL